MWSITFHFIVLFEKIIIIYCPEKSTLFSPDTYTQLGGRDDKQTSKSIRYGVRAAAVAMGSSGNVGRGAVTAGVLK